MHGLSLDELAKLMGMSPQTISMWRAARRQPSGNALLQIGELFEIDPVALSLQEWVDVLPLVADQDRYRRVEAKIKKRQRKLSAV
jgi:transcriptional regulator with XRE-family HTH domain